MVLQGCQKVSRTGHAHNVGIGCHIGDSNILYAAYNHSHAFAFQSLEDSRNIRIGNSLSRFL